MNDVGELVSRKSLGFDVSSFPVAVALLMEPARRCYIKSLGDEYFKVILDTMKMFEENVKRKEPYRIRGIFKPGAYMVELYGFPDEVFAAFTVGGE